MLVSCAPGGSSAHDDEYAVYAALIEDRYLWEGVDLIVIRNETTLFELGPDVTFEQVSRSAPALEEETYADFLAVNEEPTPLDGSLDLGFEVALVSPQELEEIFAADVGSYDAFYERFPNSQGVMELSRVGFNADRSQALVYVGNQHAPLGGAGYYLILNKDDGAWQVDSELPLWIS
jgi:hypothetical protein